MKSNFLLFVFVLFASSLVSQTTPPVQQFTGNINTDVHNFLPEGKITVDIMDGVKQDPRQMELGTKLQNGIRKNYEWFIEYIKKAEDGKPMGYHPKLGVTKAEYKELQNFMDSIEVVATGQEILQIKKQENVIRFEAPARLDILNNVVIDLGKNVVQVNEYELQFSDTNIITDDKNAFKSKWKGYSWRFDFPETANLDALKDLQSVKMKSYKFILGQMDKDGKIYLSVKAREIENGAYKINIEIPLLFSLK